MFGLFSDKRMAVASSKALLDYDSHAMILHVTVSRVDWLIVNRHVVV